MLLRDKKTVSDGTLSIEKTGKVATDKDSMFLGKDNDQLPIYDNTNGCYVFVHASATAYGRNRFRYVPATRSYSTSPFFFDENNTNEEPLAHNLLKTNSELTGVSAIVRVSWLDASGNYTGSQDFTWTKTFLETHASSFKYLANGNGQYGTFTGTFNESIINQGEDMTMRTVIASETGVEIASIALDVTGAVIG